MNLLITEMKTRARLLLNLLQAGHVAGKKQALMLSRKQGWELPETWQLRHCLNLAAADIGFQHWEHARRVLSGQAEVAEDMGEFWPKLDNPTTHYSQAQAQLRLQPELFLLPYRLEFMLVSADYLQALGVATEGPEWSAINHDLVAGYASTTWLNLAAQRLEASRYERMFAQWDASQINQQLQCTEQEVQRVMQSFVKNGRLVKIPDQRKKRLVILRWLVAQLQPERQYLEKELNQFLSQFHEDHATLRREFIGHALMQRDNGIYWRV